MIFLFRIVAEVQVIVKFQRYSFGTSTATFQVIGSLLRCMLVTGSYQRKGSGAYWADLEGGESPDDE